MWQGKKGIDTYKRRGYIRCNITEEFHEATCGRNEVELDEEINDQGVCIHTQLAWEEEIRGKLAYYSSIECDVGQCCVQGWSIRWHTMIRKLHCQ